MKVLIIAPQTLTIYNFRGNLIKDMIKAGHDVVAVAPELEGAEHVRELGAEFIRLDFHRASTNPIKDMILIFNIRKLVKEVKPDVVFGYTIKPVVYGSIGARLAGVKNIYSMVTGLGHAFLATTAKEKAVNLIAKTLYKIAFSVNKNVIFQNQDDIDEFVSYKLLKKEKCRIVDGSGVDLEKFKGKPLPEKPVFLMIGRLLREKGLVEFLEAAKIIKEKYPLAEFKLVGPFDKNPTSLKREDLQPYIDNQIIEYLGLQKDVRVAMNQSSIYVLPSYREGTSRTALEAMAMGRPIITTDAPGCKETVKEGVNGFMVPVKNVQALVEKMEWFINHMDQVQKMGAASHQYCKERYDVNKVNQDMLNIMKLNSK